MIRVLPDAEAAARAAAMEVAARAQRAVEEHGRFDMALAGGHTPRRMYELLAGEPAGDRAGDPDRDPAGQMPWDRVHVFWGDERCVPPDHPQSNCRMARETLLDRVPLDPGAIHRIPGELGPDAAAAAYRTLLEDHFGTATPGAGSAGGHAVTSGIAGAAAAAEAAGPGTGSDAGTGSPAGTQAAGTGGFDLVILGAGADGHTASLFPGQVEPDDPRWARGVRAPEGVEPTDRVTLTLRALNAIGAALFLVTGAEKREVVAAVRRVENDQPPAGLVRPPGGALWIVDAAAAG